ncbi:MAG: hypothetical protein ACHQ7M_18510, partial [Chloroflexota bacterium]
MKLPRGMWCAAAAGIMDMLDVASKRRMLGKAKHAGGRAALAKPDWTAKAVAWGALRAPAWRWNQTPAPRSLSSMLPNAWPWQQRQLTGILPD